MTSLDATGPLDGRGTLPPRPRLIGDQIVGEGASGGDDGVPRPSADSFTARLADALGHVQQLSSESKDLAAGLARGEAVDLHDLMLASGKSEVAFNLTLELRNKLLEAWEKLSRAVV